MGHMPRKLGDGVGQKKAKSASLGASLSAISPLSPTGIGFSLCHDEVPSLRALFSSTNCVIAILPKILCLLLPNTPFLLWH